MRSLLARDLDLTGLELDTAIAAYLLDPAEARYELALLVERYTRFAAPADDPATTGQLDLDGTQADAPAAPPATHSPSTISSSRSARASPIRAWPSSTARSRTRSCACWRGWSTPASPSTTPRCRGSTNGSAPKCAASGSSCARSSGATTSTSTRRSSCASCSTRPRRLGGGSRPIKRTKTGASTDAQTLEKLRDQWPEFIGPLLQYREVEKLRGTYGEGLLAEVAADGRIHATFNQTVARTGRLSSDRPNLHNIPVRRDEGRMFRRAFVAAPGGQLLVADYNQIELRCIAHLAADPGLIAAFTSGENIHTATAARVFGVAPADVTLDQRSKAKMVSYGLAYGMEAYGLGQRLNIPTEDAAKILEAYFEAFPNVKAYMDKTVIEARKRGYTETLFGRRRPIPELLNGNWRIRQAGERQAMNAGIQGLAADIFKVALVRVDQALEERELESRLVLQVHDEVIVEVPESEREVVGPLVVDLMRHAAELDVPLEVNVAWGTTWADTKS